MFCPHNTHKIQFNRDSIFIFSFLDMFNEEVTREFYNSFVLRVILHGFVSVSTYKFLNHLSSMFMNLSSKNHSTVNQITAWAMRVVQQAPH